MRIQDLLEIELPIVQAPMAGVQDHALAAAVSEAGGLGSLPCAMLTADAMRREIQQFRSRTRKPLNANFFCHTPPASPDPREQAWKRALRPYFEEHGLDIDAVSTASARAPFSAEAANVVEELKPEVISFHFGLPSEPLLSRARATGAKLLASATTLDEAMWLQARGVDAIIAQGFEAGGHRGMFLSEDLSTQVGTLALVRRIAQAVRVPVIAAGGIADARGVEAARALGAAGAQVGTAYLLCPEAQTSALHRAALASARAQHTALTNVFTGRPARGIVNRLIRELGPVSAHAPAFPLAASAIAALRKSAEARGSDDFSPLWCGQNASGCREVPAARLTLELARR